jgi:hypothetical protein
MFLAIAYPAITIIRANNIFNIRDNSIKLI